MCKLLILAAVVGGDVASEDRYRYEVRTMEDTIRDTTPAGYLARSNKNEGVGYSIVFDNIRLHPDPESNSIRSTTANYTFYFYRDGPKFYIRDRKCNFVCMNPCGTVYTSPVRLQHQCKFAVGLGAGGLFKIYAVSRGVNTTYRGFEFVREDNILRGRIRLASEADVSASFRLEGQPRHERSCKRIASVPQKNLDVRREGEGDDVNRCSMIDTAAVFSNPNADVVVREETKRYYALRMDRGYLDGNGALSARKSVFVKHYVSPNVYVFRNAETCKFLCLSRECGLFASGGYTAECQIRVEQSLLRDTLFVRFLKTNYYLSYNEKTGRVDYAENAKSRVEFEETAPPGTGECTPFSTSDPGPAPPRRGCPKNSGETLVISLPSLLLVAVLNFNRTDSDN